MIVDVDGALAHSSTGGVELSGDDPVVLLIHGAGHDSTVWQLQTRYLAYRGSFDEALAPDVGEAMARFKPGADATSILLARFLDCLIDERT